LLVISVLDSLEIPAPFYYTLAAKNMSTSLARKNPIFCFSADTAFKTLLSLNWISDMTALFLLD